ncbi:MAG: helix-turn-helix domain-containing protein [Bacteroidales bacterium]|nr:helix-turn-helix domain-containing protein [Bacteroidales bacterium]
MTRGGLLYIFATLVSLVLTLPVHAASDLSSTCLARFNDVSNGLPNDFVDDVFQDSYGFMWIATSGGGLCRYDGYETIVFSTNSETRINNNFVKSLAEDAFHRLWVCSEGGFNVIDLSTLRTIELPESALSSYRYDYCSFVTVDSDGSLWLKAGSSLIKVEFDDKGAIGTVTSENDPKYSPQNQVFEDVDQDGSVWMHLNGHIYKITAEKTGGFSTRPVLGNLILREDVYVSDYLKKDNELWISTEDGLYRYNLSSGMWKLYVHSPSDPRSLSQNFISGLALTSDGQILAASLMGLNVYDNLSDRFDRIRAGYTTNGPSLLSSDFINCIKVYGDNIWLGTESAGFVQIYPKPLPVENYSGSDRIAGALPQHPVNAIFEDSHERLWVGSVEAGLSCLGEGWEGFRRFTVENSKLSHNSVSMIAEDDMDRLWVGTWGGGISIVSTSVPIKVLETIESLPEFPERFSFIGTLAMDRKNRLMWIGTNIGIYYYDLENGDMRPALKDQPYGCIGSLIDKEGNLWIGTQDGIFIFNLNNRTVSSDGMEFPFVNYRNKLDDPESRVAEKISCFMQAADGTIWVGSNGNGIYKARKNDEDSWSFINYGHDRGLVNDCVKGILEDRSGVLWISTESGLSMFSQESGRFTSYSVMDGLESSHFYWNASLKGHDGKLYFGHIDGMSVISPETAISIRNRSGLQLTSISVGEKVTHEITPRILKIHERDRSIGFEFSSLSYGPEQSVNYSYKIDGIDSEWIEIPMHRNFITFPSLINGKYELQVRAHDPSGAVIGAIELPIKVKPYFYHSMWFYVLVVLTIVYSIIRYQRWKMKSLMRYNKQLQETVEERTREISEQKLLIEQKADELSRQNQILKRQNEELASQKMMNSQENKTEEESKNDKFVAKALEVVREYYKDPDLDVATFCTAMGLSKTLLNKKMKEAMGQSVSQFIRTYRLSIAREMLINNSVTKTMNISEIAYEVGFNDPKYFTRCFTKEFDVSPSSFPKE